MKRFAEFAVEGRGAWLNRDGKTLARLIDANFDLRRSICRIPKAQLAMVDAARSVGASAKFCGSGGAITGTCQDEAQFARLVQRLSETGCQVFQPTIPEGQGTPAGSR
jgi:glucuronokinase